MRELIPKDELGVFADTNDTARVDSLFVAECFEKEHKNVLRDIQKIIAPNSGLSDEFRQLNFEPSYYRNKQNKKQPCYYLTRDGFTMLVMGYTCAKAMKFKEMYIKRFNEMEQFIKSLVSARQEFPLLTENIKLLHDHPKPYHFSNECDMLNRIVVGMSAKQFRLANDIEKGKSIRPYLSDSQIQMLEILQKVDVGLLVAVPDYEQRKRYLEWYKQKLEGGEI
ncbi:Rha family transcriptional regulator [Ruminococcus bicirculans (ex Wegman et al. 2014)]|jgi:Rha family phage regulatory protein|uniref:Rha family transcriptional regulator n=2 Tax=root TaxID=1 RepID=A0AAW6E2U9_9FIRM|nr:Rha family transcriptional regulator [Ruminococcus bicirculans (ex Wegman et al. 2014)]MDB8736269.1 Rha family transcriptional regulator [Ruminococcus bicirculans (ex Wegman et al. 2014)]MDB8742411.1 Rha family transcriptional regulator [Ruminococcus bicirculans (ex Wegman et al. 2014)]DAD72870.1 MAG TPA: regulatory protein [Siphoviridae sp. ctMAv2]